LWENHPVEQVATPEGFAADPKLVHRFYNLRRAALSTVEPNVAHKALAKLQIEFDGQITLVTQNVDDLHERGGSPEVIHMHGELRSAFCTACHHRWQQLEDLSVETPCPACQTLGGPRPDIVWFGEMPYEMDRIERALQNCDLFVVQLAHMHGARTLELNLEPSQGSAFFSETRHGPATQLVPEWVASLL